MQTALARISTTLMALAALPALPLWPQTTCNSPIGLYPALSSVLLNAPFKSGAPSTQMVLSSNSFTPLTFTISNIQSAGGWLGVNSVPGGNFNTASFTGSAAAEAPFNITVTALLLSSLVSGQQYTGQFTVTPSVGAPIVIPVTLNLGPALNPAPTVTLSQNCVSFDTGVPLPQRIFMTSSGSGWGGHTTFTFDPISYIVGRLNTDGAWMQFDTAIGNEFLVSPSMAADLLSSGVYSGKINFMGSGNSPTFSIPVTLTVRNGLTLTPAALQFNTLGTAQQTLTITGGTGSFYAGVQSTITIDPPTSSGHSGWLSISPSGANLQSPVAIAVSVDATGLGAGTYNGEIDLYTGFVYRRIAVTLVVPPHGDVVVSNSSAAPVTGLAFTAPAGATSLIQQVQISSASQTSNSSGISFTYSASAPWLLINGAQSGQSATPANLPIAANAGSLSSGTYQASITVTPLGGHTLIVPVELTVVPSITAVTNAASFLPGPVAAGEIVSIFGNGLGPAPGVSLTSDLIVNGQLPTSLGGVQVLIGGVPSPLVYAGATQISAIVPYEISAPALIANPGVQVKFQGLVSSAIALQQAAAAPAIFTAGSKGTGQGAILNSDLSPNSSINPAHAGDIIVLYVTGEGQTNPPGVTGRLTAASGPFPQPLLQPAVTIGGQPAQVVFYGEAPGQVAGLMQINVQVPITASFGDLPVTVTIGNARSQSAPNGQGAVTAAVH